MSTNHTGNVEPSVDLEEHRSVSGVNAKAVAPYGWSGTALIPSPSPFLDVSYDYVGFSNPDANGNYQTIAFNTGGSGGALQRTLTLAYDGSSNVTSITRT
jgi:hypothetical protein